MTEKYVIVINWGQSDANCASCEFAGKTTIECETKEELIKEWIFQVDEGRNVEVYKRLDLEVVIKNEVTNDR